MLEEPDNPFIPLLFSIYLDRISLRINDGTLDETALNMVFEIMKDAEIEDFKKQNYNIMLIRHFYHLKDHQQRISSLSTTSNRKIKEDAATLARVKDSLSRYEDLLNYSRAVMKEIMFMESGLDDELKQPMMDLYDYLNEYADLLSEFNEYVDGDLNNSRALMKETIFVEGGLDDELKQPMMDLYDLLNKYADDRVRLTSLVDDLEAYQNSLN